MYRSVGVIRVHKRNHPPLGSSTDGSTDVQLRTAQSSTRKDKVPERRERVIHLIDPLLEHRHVRFVKHGPAQLRLRGGRPGSSDVRANVEQTRLDFSQLFRKTVLR